MTVFPLGTPLETIKASTVEVRKGFHGWVAETTVILDDDKHALQFTTMKRHNGSLTTSVIRGRYEPPAQGHPFAGFHYQPFADYSATARSVSGIRVTSRAVVDQHKEVMTKLEDFIAACAKHYERKTA